ncbi:glycosyltransferase [Serpentinicella sp. ANB-PHB4]|uniref:glycosyltransferase n=1 Tax=Serpentinicella sp. ANB-PHB4 TaxID=3074076 RepID=UPI002861925D|nr:glycosyltransferase [Serpentinicella sp. ANB-PHB4]MDR5658094.1 glycosyltransferase [Serpentinicella sp. ANB-PHB4]
MKVLMYIRRDYQTNLAGDSIQLIKTKQYLEQRGIDITVSSNLNEDLRPYDLIHLFNTIRIEDTYHYLSNVIKYKKKVALTPIYWNLIKYLPYTKKNELLRLKWKKLNAMRSKVFKNVDIILPSSETEMEAIREEFDVKNPYIIVPNGVDKAFETGNQSKFRKLYNMKDFVLCVGRICPHKNQLALAKITKKLEIPLMLLGPINDPDYFNLCMSANNNIVHVPIVKHHDICHYYKAAKVHALISWYEIPGLVNLEAGLTACNILTTEGGSTKDYFKNYAEYSKYYDIDNIEIKLKQLLKRGKNTDLQKHIKENYLWESVTEKILLAYDYLL